MMTSWHGNALRITGHFSLHWRHNDHDGVSNHQSHGCLLNRLFRRRSKITSKLRVTGLCVGNSPGPVNSPHKGPVTRKMFPFDDVIMWGKPRVAGPGMGIIYVLFDISKSKQRIRQSSCMWYKTPLRSYDVTGVIVAVDGPWQCGDEVIRIISMTTHWPQVDGTVIII